MNNKDNSNINKIRNPFSSIFYCVRVSISFTITFSTSYKITRSTAEERDIRVYLREL